MCLKNLKKSENILFLCCNAFTWSSTWWTKILQYIYTILSKPNSFWSSVLFWFRQCLDFFQVQNALKLIIKDPISSLVYTGFLFILGSSKSYNLQRFWRPFFTSTEHLTPDNAMCNVKIAYHRTRQKSYWIIRLWKSPKLRLPK